MAQALIIANVERAADHGAALGIVVLVAAVGGLLYGLVRLLGKRRAGRPRAGRGPGTDRGGEA